jgi:hypothetical protein
MEQRVLLLHSQGKQRNEIKRETGVSLPTIRKILRENGYGDDINEELYGERYTDTELDEIFHLYQDGNNASQIADKTGKSKRGVMLALRRKYEETVSHWRNHHGIPPLEFIEAWQTSSTVGEVAEKLGVERGSVLSRAHVYRKKGVPLKQIAKPYDWPLLAEFAGIFSEQEQE